MRIVPFVITAIAAAGLVVALNTRFAAVPAMGKLLSPQHGIWQNAEPLNEDFSAELKFPQLKGKVSVYLDDRLVPHVFAEQEGDAHFVQGYLHARFRLWQMELQTHAAAGRAAEIVGPVALQHDREFRRLGMVYAAENSLMEMEKDPFTKAACDNYTAGVNAYIESLTESRLPLEYKLIGYQPEKWSNLKTMLFLKYMSYDLAGHDSDFEMTNAKNYFSPEAFNKLFPPVQDSLDPIIPKDAVLPEAQLKLSVPAKADSAYLGKGDEVTATETKPHPENGSNNWAVDGKKTQSGAPILCNDPHLGLNLPSLWFEIQISTPQYNAYGVSFPGAPGVIIGFNDSCAFGFTNGGRDVRDYYEIKFKDDSKREYWFNGEWTKTTLRVDRHRVKGAADFLDTVAYTVFGPVMYDKSFSGGRQTNNKSYAVTWTAHRPSNELRIFLELDRAKNYNDYLNAVQYLHTPGQNCLFASKSGDIALRTQGEFPAKWTGQGDFVMPGADSSYMWQGMIPFNEVPFQYNPERGFVSSANQRPVGYNYPYYLGREYPIYRGIIVNRMLAGMSNITAQDMMQMQVDNYNVLAEMARPILLKNIRSNELDAAGQQYLDQLRNWDLRNNPASTGATVFAMAWGRFQDTVFKDEYAKAPQPIEYPLSNTLVEALLKDSAYLFLDNIATAGQKETLADNVTAAFKTAVVELKKLEASGRLGWAAYKGTGVYHLAKLAPFSRTALPIGGGGYSINAATNNHGPSWRMVVHLTQQTEAYGIYPGGQNGNPASRYYDNFVDKWAAGEYYRLWVMKKEETGDKRVKAVMKFN
jgi:penicillin G amidase